MLALTQITPLHWAGFILAILFFLALDLGVFHRSAHVVRFKEALLWSGIWFLMALLFARGLLAWRGYDESIEFLTGYLIELSLSMDNVFIMALIFGYFAVPPSQQHRVLFWGIVGALLMRGIMIGIGGALISTFHWVLYIFGAFLVFTGIRMAMSNEQGVDPEKNLVIRLAKKFFPISHEFDGQKFFTRINGARALTPLALVLLMVETTDLIFAVDSIPAIFAVTEKTFIVFTSNVFAILGLRSLYFVLAGAISYFRYLKFGLSIVLVFIGGKMLIAKWHHIPSSVSLIIVAGIIGVSIFVSLISVWRQKPPQQQA
ncbi:MAG: TerC family protein [Limisphaerales bacterium]